jgi:DNA-binding Lrp family transcriptional regulator
MDAQAKTLHAIKLNFARRHLTTAGKQTAIQKALQAAPEKSDRQLAKAIGVSDKTVGAVRKELEESAEIPHFTARQDPRTGRLSQPTTRQVERKAPLPAQR